MNIYATGAPVTNLLNERIYKKSQDSDPVTFIVFFRK